MVWELLLAFSHFKSWHRFPKINTNFQKSHIFQKRLHFILWPTFQFELPFTIYELNRFSFHFQTRSKNNSQQFRSNLKQNLHFYLISGHITANPLCLTTKPLSYPKSFTLRKTAEHPLLTLLKTIFKNNRFIITPKIFLTKKMTAHPTSMLWG